MQHYILGLDIGSVSVAAVAVGNDGTIVRHAYRAHHGRIGAAVEEVLRELALPEPVVVVGTGSGTHLIETHARFHWQTASVAAVRALSAPERFPAAILLVGGEEFGLIELGEDREYRGARTNSSCAAGTGSFLDQQAERLMLDGGPMLAEAAARNARENGAVPDIASRCSVFAKTDLIHAQQEGYSVEEICDGLCCGLARNLVATLFSDQEVPQPLLFVGGVACNQAVVRHLERLLDVPLERPERPELFAAYGATQAYREATASGRLPAAETIRSADLSALLRTDAAERHEPMHPAPKLRLSRYPDFEGHGRREYPAAGERRVELDLYEPWRENRPSRTGGDGSQESVFLGIDIGSTSTKAVVLDRDRQVLLGLYTRTAGRPIRAVQALFEALDELCAEEQRSLRVDGAATTGSGRKFVGAVIGADTIMDEISAHARAAYELDPQLDTIIEIGGQDAKFTTMRSGRVTFSQMNTICAAGTGSFLEEQAARLNVPLSQFAERAEQSAAPLVSDRCTVFMERDISTCLARGNTPDELLAAAAYAVTENYLQKVAVQAAIGERICFQGATAKNRALVAAFEHKLGRPISVSRYAHLTGALGAALTVMDERRAPAEAEERRPRAEERRGESAAPGGPGTGDGAAGSAGGGSRFRGFGLHREEIPIRTETCEICSNRCRIRVATVGGEEVAYGFMCGRDYHNARYVERNRSGFDLEKARRRAFSGATGVEREHRAGQSARTASGDGASIEGLTQAAVRVGIPRGPGMDEELPMWRRFFALLGFETVVLDDGEQVIPDGRRVTAAEFCAPMVALHGEAARLATRAEYLFLPVKLQDTDAKRKRKNQYCYYTQYAMPVVVQSGAGWSRERVIAPVISADGGRRTLINEVHRALQRTVVGGLERSEVASAYREACRWFTRRRARLRRVYRSLGPPENDEVRVVLIGRPYTVLNSAMNKRIPALFGEHGVKTVFQDMLPVSSGARRSIAGVLDAVHWHYAVQVLAAAAGAAETEGLYPVFVTSFKCSPDSFVIEYFKRIMERAGKPYIVLQLDEHSSSVGYETRIEAAVRAFRNHRSEEQARPQAPGVKLRAIRSVPGELGGSADLRALLRKQQDRVEKGRIPVNPKLSRRLRNNTVLFPSWDPITCRLLVANLRRAGYDARLLPETEHTIRAAMRHNTGQCLPVNIIAEEFMRYIRENNLDPSRTVLWMANAGVGCNIRMFPYFIKSMLERHGNGMEEAGVYTGDISHLELSPALAVNAYFAYLAGGFVRRSACRLRPYELEVGATDRAVQDAIEILENAFSGGESVERALHRAADLFAAVPVRAHSGQKPKVAIIGDLYLRDNEVMNQDLIQAIEDAGGEVVTTPYNEYVKIVSQAYFERMRIEKRYGSYVGYSALLSIIEAIERRLLGERFSAPHPFTDQREIEATLEKFAVRIEHTGETHDNLLKVIHLVREHPDLALVVHAGPSFCCPSLIPEALADRIREVTGVPVVSLTYDGTGTYQNDKIAPYLSFAAASGDGTATGRGPAPVGSRGGSKAPHRGAAAGRRA